ncbi:class I SAM-dependent methyltransferase [Algiphilus sp.]|uniref:class I SAM-dependent methyltransferase n=1 Tax=Algiphilus sp. TaxID=1872431 RepID=UPI003B52FFFF
MKRYQALSKDQSNPVDQPSRHSESTAGTTAFVHRSACPACAATTRRTLKSVPMRHPSVAGFLERYYEGRIPLSDLADMPFDVAECDACGTIYQTAILSPPRMLDLYEHWIDPAQSFEKRRGADHTYYAQIANEVMGIRRLTSRLPRDTQVLDFGMGWGNWLQMARGFGYQTTGFELSEQRAAYGREHGLRVASTLCELEPASFHYIYANQVLEHVPDPRASLQDIAALLAPGGIADIHVPNQLGIRRKLASKHWQASHDAIHPLEHINCFNRRALLAMGRAFGLQSITPPYPGLRTPQTLGVKDVAVYLFNRTISTHVFFVRNV